MKKNHLSTLLMEGTIGIVVLFWASAPLFYLLIARSSVVWLDLGARALRLALAVGLCWMLRSRNRGLLLAQTPGLKAARAVVGGIALISLILQANGTLDQWYGTAYYTVGYRIGGMSGMPVWMAVIFEQMLGGDLLWCLLAGFGVMLFPASRASKVSFEG